MRRRRVPTHNILVSSLLLALAGCASPSPKTILAFAESTAGAASIAESAAQLDIDIQTRINATRAALAMTEGRRAPLPPSKGVLAGGNIDASWGERSALLKSISAYAAALAEVADPALADSVIEAASGLSVSLSDFAAARAARIRDERKRDIAIAEAQRISALGNVLVALGDYLVSAGIAGSIQQVTTATHPVMERARDILKEDLALIVISARQKRNTLATVFIDKLTVHAADARLSSVDKQGLYMSAHDELNAIDGRINVVAGFGSILDKMVEAHGALRSGASDKQAVLDFIAAVQAVAIKIEEYQETERKLRDLRRS